MRDNKKLIMAFIFPSMVAVFLLFAALMRIFAPQDIHTPTNPTPTFGTTLPDINDYIDAVAAGTRYDKVDPYTYILHYSGDSTTRITVTPNDTGFGFVTLETQCMPMPTEPVGTCDVWEYSLYSAQLSEHEHSLETLRSTYIAALANLPDSDLAYPEEIRANAALDEFLSDRDTVKLSLNIAKVEISADTENGVVIIIEPQK